MTILPLKCIIKGHVHTREHVQWVEEPDLVFAAGLEYRNTAKGDDYKYVFWVVWPAELTGNRIQHNGGTDELLLCSVTCWNIDCLKKRFCNQT